MLFTISHAMALAPFLAFTLADHSVHTAEIFYLTNCFNDATLAGSAEFDWYANSSLSILGGDPNVLPDLKAVINAEESVDYEDGTWVTLPGAPFNLTVFIEDNSYTATTGTIVGHATSSTFAGTLKCERLTRVIPYETTTVTCYSDYACVDSGTVFPSV